MNGTTIGHPIRNELPFPPFLFVRSVADGDRAWWQGSMTGVNWMDLTGAECGPIDEAFGRAVEAGIVPGVFRPVVPAGDAVLCAPGTFGWAMQQPMAKLPEWPPDMAVARMGNAMRLFLSGYDHGAFSDLCHVVGRTDWQRVEMPSTELRVPPLDPAPGSES